MSQLQAVVTAYQTQLLLGLVALNLVVLIVLVVSIVKSNSVRRQYQNLMRGARKENMEELILQQSRLIQEAADQVNQLSMRTNKLETEIESCLQKTALIRFNAYDNMGSDLSFSLALLDKKDSGVVISSLYGREESRSYAKPVNNGASSYPLSEEEEEAINKAKKSLLSRNSK